MPQFEGYQLGKLLGQGAFGETYEAVKNGQRVAIKLIREDAIQRDVDLHRFQREVRSLQKAVGPNVVRFIDSGVGQLGNETRYYVAMEYLEGQDLARAFRAAGNKLQENDLKSILIQIINGLKTVHDQGSVHRDLKPANIFLTTGGEIKLLDFGLVKMLDYTTLTTRPGQAIGTPLFIAPEILRAETVDFRADFYSLGVIIYHLVTRGSYPLSAGTPLELFARVVYEPPTPPTRYNHDLSSDFENIILELLSKQPYERKLVHGELAHVIETTPLSILTNPNPATAVKPKIYNKRCFFHLLNTEKSELEEFIRAGGSIHGFMYPANFMPQFQNSLKTLRDLGLKYLLDPVTYRLTYSSFSQTQGLVKLPYVPDPNNVLTPDALRTLKAQQKYAQGCIDWQMQWRTEALIAPFHFARDLNSEWIDIDIKLIEESISYARSLQGAPGVFAGLCLNIEYYTTEDHRLALLNRYSRTKADGYLFYVDTLDERTANPIQLRSYLSLLQLFQKLGKPVIESYPV